MIPRINLQREMKLFPDETGYFYGPHFGALHIVAGERAANFSDSIKITGVSLRPHHLRPRALAVIYWFDVGAAQP